MVITLNREDVPDRFFYIYDVYKGEQVRKIYKKDVMVDPQSPNDSGEENQQPLSDVEKDPDAFMQSDAFDVDPHGQILIYCHGRHLNFQSVNLPDSIKKHMAPQYRVSEHKYSPARIQEMK